MAEKQINTTADDAEAMSRLRDLITNIRIAMVTTEGADGTLHSRPMYAQQAEADGDLWFATSRGSDLVKELREKARILATFSDTSSQRYVVIRGEGHEHNDQAKIQELWNPRMAAWFPSGPNDPDLTLVHLHAERADVWDSPSGPSRLIRYVTALVTGSTPDGGDRLSVDLKTSAERVVGHDVSA